MKAVLTEEKATVYGSTDEHSISIATIHKGELLELGKVVRKGGKLFEKKPLRGGLWYPKLNLFYTEKVWVEITLPGDQKGYIEGNTSIFAVKKAALYSKTADLLETANKNGFVIKTLKDGAILTVIGIDKTEEGSWFKVTDENGVTGYAHTRCNARGLKRHQLAFICERGTIILENRNGLKMRVWPA